jgi:hypothetical protein
MILKSGLHINFALIASAICLQVAPAFSNHNPTHNRLVAHAELKLFIHRCIRNGGTISGSSGSYGDGRVVCISANGGRITCQLDGTAHIQCWRGTMNPPRPRPPKLGRNTIDEPTIANDHGGSSNPPPTSPPPKGGPSPNGGIK